MAIPAASVQAVDTAIAAQSEELLAMYADIHQHPELGFMEERTAGIVADTLRGLGYEVTTGIGGTGVAAILRNGEGPTAMYRADMDANAVEEASDFPYTSKVRVKRPDGTESPVAHMCGHDAHVTWMLGMAKFLAEHRDLWAGTAVLIGQPAEEMIQGAKAMIDDDLYSVIPKPDHYIAMHTVPTPVGTVIVAPGTRMAGTDQLDVLMQGAGGHGSTPHVTKDPILMGALAVTQYQSIVSRVLNPQQVGVVTVGAFQAGADNNVIPDNALLKVNLRWFEKNVREEMLASIHSITDSIARSYSLPESLMPKYTMKGGSTPLVNDDDFTARIAANFADILGGDAVITEAPAVTGSEDAHLLMEPHEDIDFCYFNVGVANADVYAAARARGDLFPYGMHSAHFVVDLAAVPFGARLASYAMLELLGK